MQHICASAHSMHAQKNSKVMQPCQSHGSSEEMAPATAPTCASCLCTLAHGEEPIVIALGQHWHCDCFRCSVCDVHLHDWYFEREGLLYCRDDYYARFGDACQQCTAVITGPVMVAGEHKFHPECFCCAACGSFIGEGEAYALVERSKLYCGQCYCKRQQTQAGDCDSDAKAITTAVAAAARGQNKPMHSIRLVEIPKNATPGLRVDGGALDDGCPTVRISEIDVNLTNLHIGDRILEVNGTPVNDSSIEQIDKLIRSTEKMLQLTVEHDPVQVCRSCSQADIQRACSASTLALPLTTSASSVEVGGRERLYKAAEQSAKARKMRKTAAAAAATTAINAMTTTPLKEKERCSSLSKLLDEQHTAQQHSAHPQLYDLSRTQSCRVVQKPQRIFRASDLVIGEKLGEGFFGKVYKVTHRLTGEVMVLKELHRADEEAQRNFIKEVAVLRLLDHRHVLKFIGVLYKDKKLHMVTEYVAGGTLKELIHDSEQSLGWPERVCFARDIACGMSYLHSMNIIHRDLNSMNCLVREDLSVIVADFGLARSVDAPRLPGSTGGPSVSAGNLSAGVTAGGSSGDGISLMSAGSPLSAGGTLRRSKSRQRRQRYTVVGNPYWMAPEMMKGLKYDEKVDVFSFGIMLCEIIGRVEADPDFMPRNSDFSLNQQEFREKFCAQCPEAFIKVAFVCCDLNPDMRPCFETLHVWLEQLRTHLASKQMPPLVLLHEIENFQDNYLSSEDALSPTSQRSLDNLHVLCQQATPAQAEPAQTPTTTPTLTPTPTTTQPEEKENVTMRTHDIPKSPHLGKDFSPTGERLRDSMRARRRQRVLGAQQQRRGQTPETTSTERALKQALKKCRPFGEKGYLVDLRPGAELQLHDVCDLNVYSDFDSSCDTSLNYNEANAPPAEESATTTPTSTPTPQPDSAISPHRLAFEDLRTRLHHCRSKFEHLEKAYRRNLSQSQHSMRNFFKTPPVALKMFQRLENEALNGNADGMRTTQRINQTPIFGRRTMPPASMEHAESLEHLPGPSKPPRRTQAPAASNAAPASVQPTPAPKRSKATPTTPTNCSAELQAPANNADCCLPRKHTMTLPLSTPSVGRAHSSQTAAKPKTTCKVPPTTRLSPTQLRPGSPAKHLAERHTAATAQRANNAVPHAPHPHHHAHYNNTKTTRLNILSPEKVHRLNAKISDRKQAAAATAPATVVTSNGRHPAPTHQANNGVGERRKRAPPLPARAHFNTRC